MFGVIKSLTKNVDPHLILNFLNQFQLDEEQTAEVKGNCLLKTKMFDNMLAFFNQRGLSGAGERLPVLNKRYQKKKENMSCMSTI